LSPSQPAPWTARRAAQAEFALPMNIIILDDYQDAVRKLRCASKL
jgi:hypothetical protein